MRATLLTLAIGLSACGVKEDKWPEQLAHAQCAFAKRCATTYFFYQFDDQADCEDEYLDYWDEFGSKVYESCSFDEDNAKKCLEALDSSCKEAGQDYEDFGEDCYQVWDCG